jgi:hypothetical protein
MRRLAAFIFLAAGVGTFAQAEPSQAHPQEPPKAEAASAPSAAAPQAQPAQPAAQTPVSAAAEVAAPPQEQAAPAPPVEVKAPEEKGLAFMKEIAKGNFVGTLKYVAYAHQRVLSPGKLQYAWERVGKRIGKIQDMTVTHTDLEGDNLVMHVLLTCERGTGEARLTYSAKAKDDLLTGVQFVLLDAAPAG